MKLFLFQGSLMQMLGTMRDEEFVCPLRRLSWLVNVHYAEAIYLPVSMAITCVDWGNYGKLIMWG